MVYSHLHANRGGKGEFLIKREKKASSQHFSLTIMLRRAIEGGEGRGAFEKSSLLCGSCQSDLRITLLPLFSLLWHAASAHLSLSLFLLSLRWRRTRGNILFLFAYNLRISRLLLSAVQQAALASRRSTDDSDGADMSDRRAKLAIFRDQSILGLWYSLSNVK